MEQYRREKRAVVYRQRGEPPALPKVEEGRVQERERGGAVLPTREREKQSPTPATTMVRVRERSRGDTRCCWRERERERDEVRERERSARCWRSRGRRAVERHLCIGEAEGGDLCGRGRVEWMRVRV
jgi:hypothetical protein